MKILITEKGYMIESTDAPVIGKHYYLEDAETGTNAQNKLFHALITEYWKSGLHPKYGGDDYSSFRDQIKRTLGEGFEKYVYAILDVTDGKAKIERVKTFEEIPEYIRLDPDMKEMIQGKLKSWSDYTAKQRKNCIDNLITDMDANGVNSKKYQEIMDGLYERETIKR